MNTASSVHMIRHNALAAAECIACAHRFMSTEGWLGAAEGYALHQCAAHGPGEGAIVEIGSFKGRSTSYLAAGSMKAGREPVTAVDTFRGSEEHQPGGTDEVAEVTAKGIYFREFLANLRQNGVQRHVRPLVGWSREVVANWQKPIRLLFIDGDHSYEGVKLDFEMWSPFVIDGGLVAFHDYKNPNYPQPTRFVEDMLASGSGYAMLFQVEITAVTQKIGQRG